MATCKQCMYVCMDIWKTGYPSKDKAHAQLKTTGKKYKTKQTKNKSTEQILSM